METIKLRGAGHFCYRSETPRRRWHSCHVGGIILFHGPGNFIAEGGEYLKGYATVANGDADDFVCKQGDVVRRVASGDEMTFAEWEVTRGEKDIPYGELTC